MERKHYTADFKRQVVEEWLSGEKRTAQICREHGLASCLLSKWRKEYECRGKAAFTADAASEHEQLQRHVAELERFCGKLALENDVLKKALCQRPLRTSTP